jgi:hypothetical protein
MHLLIGKTHFNKFLAAALAAAASPEAKPGKAVTSAVATVPAKDGAAVETAHLQPFANIAEIPVGSDLSSIRFEGIKLVELSTRRSSIADKGHCDGGHREPSGFMHCPSTQDGYLAPTYQITYSYNGPPIGGDEYGSTHFTFSVNVRPEDLNPTVRQTISEHKMSQTTAAEDFKLTTYRGLVPQVAIDDANSVLCAGNYIDGLWTQSDRNCEEKVSYKTVAMPSGLLGWSLSPGTATDGIGTPGLMPILSFRATESSTTRSAGVSTRRGSRLTLLTLVMASAMVATAVTTAMAVSATTVASGRDTVR